MAIHAAGFEHRVFVSLAVLTHAVVGFTLAYVWTRSESVAGLVGAVAPDVDLLFSPAWQAPFVHRGLTHTPLFGAAVVVALLVAGRRRVALGVALGYLSHLVLDSLTKSGIMWLYPVSTSHFAFDISIHSVEYTVVIWAVSLVVVLLGRRRTVAK